MIVFGYCGPSGLQLVVVYGCCGPVRCTPKLKVFSDFSRKNIIVFGRCGPSICYFSLSWYEDDLVQFLARESYFTAVVDIFVHVVIGK